MQPPQSCNRRMACGHDVQKTSLLLAKSTMDSTLTKLGIIVYRKQDNPNEISKNEDTFARAYKILENEGAFLIFPDFVFKQDQNRYYVGKHQLVEDL